MQQVSKFAMHLSFVRLKRKKTAYQGCSVSLLVNEVLLALIIQL